MATWDDVYFRNSLDDDQGTYPVNGSSSCPDIIPWGPEPLANPGTYLSENYDQTWNRALTPGIRNYVYLRAKNLKNAAQSGHVNLYYSKASLLMYPSFWTENVLANESGDQDIKFTNLASDGIFVTEEPYIWTPDAIQNDHYCMVSRVVTPDNPNPLPTESSINDVGGLRNYVGQNPNVGWRNIALGDGAGIIEKVLNFSQGTTEDQTYVQISVTGAPGGSEVAFSTSKQGPNPPLVLQKTTVPDNQPNFQAGLQSLVPANFNADIVYQYYSNGKPPTGDFKLELTYFTFTTPSNSHQDVYNRSMDIRRLSLAGHEIDALRAWFGSDVPRAYVLGRHTTLDSKVGRVANACC
ncbi:hypothetical protein PsAD2_03774 [Pseudovibrio axinellae]|uniref:Uncharacterized protein n=1 Tax=Pseudovibrio axinellae TaxID=989403 RepID=A0A165UWS8_9HYPH|nr:hypothetical protein [Pseudovibrio axinellae]KZL12947.1 hypothetical protein PsAD2_03774 [Pseudovibrio axinellae]SER69773.1 hypothetical protein SAMN05421798_1177 [Pseudovibrio axinellae]